MRYLYEDNNLKYHFYFMKTHSIVLYIEVEKNISTYQRQYPIIGGSVYWGDKYLEWADMYTSNEQLPFDEKYLTDNFKKAVERYIKLMVFS